jgi:hypothetical protein
LEGTEENFNKAIPWGDERRNYFLDSRTEGSARDSTEIRMLLGINVIAEIKCTSV